MPIEDEVIKICREACEWFSGLEGVNVVFEEEDEENQCCSIDFSRAQETFHVLRALMFRTKQFAALLANKEKVALVKPELVWQVEQVKFVFVGYVTSCKALLTYCNFLHQGLNLKEEEILRAQEDHQTLLRR